MKKTVIEKHFDKIAADYDSGKRKYSYYYTNLKELLVSLIPNNKKVFEIGCGTGDLLAYLKPKNGYGMDISTEMIRLAKSKYKFNKNLKFSTAWPDGEFDYIFMSDVVEHLEDPKEIFKRIAKHMNKNSVFINTMANPVWEPLLMFWERMTWKMPEGKHKRIKYEKLGIILKKAELKIVKHDYVLLMPVEISFLTNFINKYLEKPLKKLAFIEYFVAVKS